MTNTFYQIDTLWKHTEQDDYQQGCLPDTTIAHEVNVTFQADSIAGVIEKVAKWLGITDKDNILLNSCDEAGRVDFQVHEDAEGIAASERELKHWRQGACDLWLATYTAQVDLVTTGIEIDEETLNEIQL